MQRVFNVLSQNSNLPLAVDRTKPKPVPNGKSEQTRIRSLNESFVDVLKFSFSLLGKGEGEGGGGDHNIYIIWVNIIVMWCFFSSLSHSTAVVAFVIYAFAYYKNICFDLTWMCVCVYRLTNFCFPFFQTRYIRHIVYIIWPRGIWHCLPLNNPLITYISQSFITQFMIWLMTSIEWERERMFSVQAGYGLDAFKFAIFFAK